MMANRVVKVFSAMAIVAGFLSSCASPRLVTLPDGSKVEPAPTYLSAKQMREKGKNPYGVPETSFAFYPEKYVPSEKTGGGYAAQTESEARESFEALKKVGRVSGEFKFMPENAPAWDLSYRDPAHIRHDCFSVERLFVVPWGSGDEGIGLGAHSDCRELPIIGYVQKRGLFAIWDVANARTWLVNFLGRRVEEFPDKEGALAKSNTCGSPACDGPVLYRSMGAHPCIVYRPHRPFNFKGDQYGKIHGRSGDYCTDFYDETQGQPTYTFLAEQSEGVLLYAWPSDDGMEFLRYSKVW